MTRSGAVAVVFCLASSLAHAQAIDLPNQSFERGGGGAPDGWTLSGGAGEWGYETTPRRTQFVTVTGTGSDSNCWRSSALPFSPSTAYRVNFRARSRNASGGTPITGPVFCNRDLGTVPEQWTAYNSVFVTPRAIDPASSLLRFGQWHVKGSVSFDDVRLSLAQPAYAVREGVELGEGERLSAREYVFHAPFMSASRNHSRVLAHHNCGFNSNRWVFGAGSEVVYKHRVGDLWQRSAAVTVGVTWFRSGELEVSAGLDGVTWRELGTLSGRETREVPIPADLLPSRTVWVRLRSRAKRRAGVDSDPGSFQVGSYSYRAALRRDAPSFVGSTRFISIEEVDPRLAVAFRSIGDGLPGGRNVVEMDVRNTTDRTLSVRAKVVLEHPDSRRSVSTRSRVALRPGEQTVSLRYKVPWTGQLRMSVTFERDARLRAETELGVAELFGAAFGQRLPGSTADVALWCASSGWKISRTRPAPKERAQALVIAAARNEAEAAQLVVRPSRSLSGLQASCDGLRGPGRSTIPAANVEILRVRYVDVERPTDPTGVAAPWPDPIPPMSAPLDLDADRNQPLWVRVKVPADAAAGTYEGAVRLKANGWSARVPMRVEVYDFALPDRMSCVTAFGFSPGDVWRYQGITDAKQRRDVLAKYWRNFADHHISPYNPAPFSPVRVTWPGGSSFRGGKRDTSRAHSGTASLEVEDASATSQPAARSAGRVDIAKRGLRLRLWFRAEKGHPSIVTLSHHDASGGWMSGRNRDVRITGTGDWEQLDQTVTEFPTGARSVTLILWATVWKDDCSPTGTVWYDDVSLVDAGTGKELLSSGGFEPVAAAKLVPSFDWSSWDAAMTRAIDEYHFNSFQLAIPGMGSGTFHSRTDPSLLGFSEDTPQYRAAFGNYCGAVQAHLEERGWLDEAFVYWFDEPDPKDYAFVMNGFGKLKRAAPKIGRMLTEQIEPALVGGPNIWCPLSNHYDHDRADERRRAGDRFWWYVCTGPKAPYCTLFIDHPATEMRVWLWQTWKRDITGILVWATNYWTSSAAYPERERPQNPYEDPMGWVSGYSTPAGTKSPWGNGDGRFIYPPERAADGRPDQPVLDGPVDSIRWEMLRDGIEDYEYFVILKRLLAEKRDLLGAGERRRFEALLEVPASVSKSRTDFTTDPAPLEEQRERIARAIEDLRHRR